MNTYSILVFLALFLSATSLKAQDHSTSDIGEGHSNILNAGVGLGYAIYAKQPVLIGGINYEIGLSKDVTLAPTIGFYTYRNTYFWGNELYTHRDYRYREIAVPLGLKASYYFDDLLELYDPWDLYAGGSLGYVYQDMIWETDYMGPDLAAPHAKPFFALVHVGARYHLNERLGLFLDVSSGLSGIFGVSVKL